MKTCLQHVLRLSSICQFPSDPQQHSTEFFVGTECLVLSSCCLPGNNQIALSFLDYLDAARFNHSHHQTRYFEKFTQSHPLREERDSPSFIQFQPVFQQPVFYII